MVARAVWGVTFLAYIAPVLRQRQAALELSMLLIVTSLALFFVLWMKQEVPAGSNPPHFPVLKMEKEKQAFLCSARISNPGPPESPSGV